MHDEAERPAAQVLEEEIDPPASSTPQVDSPTGDKPPAGAVPAAPPPVLRRASGAPILITGLLALGATGLALYNYSTGSELRRALAGREGVSVRLNTAEAQLRSVEGAIRDLEAGREEYSSPIGELRLELERQSAELKRQSAELQEADRVRGADPLDWALAEVEQLLIIATHRLVFEADTATALAAMETADTRLRDLDDTRLVGIRRQFTTDLNALRSVPQVDIAGMSLYLADIIERAPQLPLRDTRLPAGESGEAPGQEAVELPAWRRLLESAWEELKDLVEISTEGGDVTYSLLPEQRYYLIQNLGLQLQIARLSVLRRDHDNLQSSLSLIDGWLEEYFDISDAGVDSIRESLHSMAKVELRPALPDISSSLETLRAFIREREREDGGGEPG